jgi:Transposase DDE domain
MGRKRRLGESILTLADDPDNEYAMIDACNHRQSPPAQRRGSKKGDSNEAIGRSCGGLTTKIHAIVDTLGNPLAVSLTGGHVHDVTQAQVLTQEIEPAALLAGKGYERRLHRASLCPQPPRTQLLMWVRDRFGEAAARPVL